MVRIGAEKRQQIHDLAKTTTDHAQIASIVSVKQRVVDQVLGKNGDAQAPAGLLREAKASARLDGETQDAGDAKKPKRRNTFKARMARRGPVHTTSALLSLGSELIALQDLGAVEDVATAAGTVDLRITEKGKRWLSLLQGVKA